MAKTSYTLRIVNPNGSDKVVLPHHSNLQVSVVLSDSGSISFDYPNNGKNAGQLGGDTEVRVLKNGVELRGARFLLDENSEDEASEDGKGAKVSWTGMTWGDAMLDACKVFPAKMGVAATYVAMGGDDQGATFANATVGAVMKNLMDKGVARGGLVNVDYASFTTTLDSSGQAWVDTINKTYDVGTTYLEVLKDLVSLGLVDYEWQGRSLKLYKPGTTLAVRRDQQAQKVVLRKGRDLSQAPRNTSRKGVASAVLLQGENGAYVQMVSGLNPQTAFRREQFFSESGVTTVAQLQAIAQQRLQQNALEATEQNVELAHLDNPKTPKPWTDYYVGDYVYLRTKTLVAYRILQMTITVDDDGIKKGSVTLNSLFSENVVRLQRAIDKVEAGVVGQVTGGGAVSVLDVTTPNPTSGLTLSTASYLDGNGYVQAIVTASWAQVTGNTDGSQATDLQGYVVEWQKQGDVNWTAAGTTTPDKFILAIGPLPINLAINVRVRAYDTTAHASGWVQASITTSRDTVGPNTPSTPSVDVATFAGMMRVVWDGKDFAGNPMPADFNRLEVHTSTVSGFTPDATTRRDALTSPFGGVSPVVGTPGVTYYVKFVAYDNSNNPSSPSTQLPAVPRSVQAGDVVSISASSIIASAVIADLTISARIKTADTGARVELNAAGIQAFGTDGVTKTIEIKSADGSVQLYSGSITGLTYQTATAGKRVVIQGGASSQYVRFYPTTAPYQPGYLQIDEDTNSYYFYMVGVQQTSGAPLSYLLFSGPKTGNVQPGVKLIAGAGSLIHLNGVAGYDNPSILFSGTMDDCSLTSVHNSITIGDGLNGQSSLIMDTNEIQARNAWAGAMDGSGNAIMPAAVLYLNNSGGDVRLSQSGSTVTSLAQLNYMNGTPPTSALAANLAMNGAGVIGKSTSSKRYKKNVRKLLSSEYEQVLELRPVSFEPKISKTHFHDERLGDRLWGFIAEEAMDLGLTHLLHLDGEGRPDGFQYERMVVPLLALVKEARDQQTKLEQRVQSLEKRVTA